MAGMTFGGRIMTTYRWGRIISTLVALFGIWQLVAPFVLDFADQQMAMRNAIATGGLLLIFGALAFFGARYWSRSTTRAFDWLAALTGFWLLISPWVLDYEAIGPAFWNAIIVGLAGLIAGVVAALRHDEATFVSS